MKICHWLHYKIYGISNRHYCPNEVNILFKMIYFHFKLEFKLPGSWILNELMHDEMLYYLNEVTTISMANQFWRKEVTPDRQERQSSTNCMIKNKSETIKFGT